MPKNENKRLEILRETELDAASAREDGAQPFIPDPADAAADKAADEAAGESASASQGSDPGWKVLLYMAAYGALRPFAERDLFEMCSVEGLPGKKVRVEAQVHWQEGMEPVRHTVKHGRGNSIRFTDSPATTLTMEEHFAAFLSKELPSQQRIPSAQRCLLVLWGHAFAGNAPNVLTQFGAPKPHGMSLHEIRNILKKFATPLHGRPIDILAFDACDMSSAEVFDTLQGLAKILIASQIGVPFSGFPYDDILEQLVAAPELTRTQVSKMILKAYHDSYTPPRVTLTMLNGGINGSAGDLLPLLEQLGDEIDRILVPDVLDIVRDTFQDARREATDPLLDLRDFCVSLRDRLGLIVSIKRAQKQGVIEAISAILRWHDEVVRAHRRRGPLVSRLHGIGVSPYLITAKWKREHMSIYDRVGWRRPPSAVRLDDDVEDELVDEVEGA